MKTNIINIFCVHDIVSDNPRSPWELNELDFERILQQLSNHNFHFGRINEINHKRESIAIFTFDDAPRGALKWINKKAQIFNLKAVVFPVIDWLESPPPRSPHHSYRSLASWKDIEESFSLGHCIGSHSMSHIPMHNIERTRLIFELESSKKVIENRLNTKVDLFSAPFGKLSEEVVKTAFEIGYSLIFSTNPGGNNLQDFQAGILKRIVLRSDLPNFGIPGKLIKKN